MPNELVLDLTDPDLDQAVANCVLGKPKTLEVTVTPTVHEPGAEFRGTVTDVAYEEPDTESATEGQTETQTGRTAQAATSAAKGPVTAGY